MWLVVQLPDKKEIHLIPDKDEYPHDENTDIENNTLISYCTCDPKIRWQHGGWTLTHNSFDGREGVEWANEVLKQKNEDKE